MIDSLMKFILHLSFLEVSLGVTDPYASEVGVLNPVIGLSFFER
jgi:hypothetical protein